MRMSLEEKVAWLADVEALKQLKYRYCAYCDDNYDPDGIASLFAEDAIWDGEPIGRLEGREAIREFFRSSGDAVPFAIHSVTNPLIELDGDEATCRWYLWQPMVFNTAEGRAPYWFSARYRDICRRLDGQWMFQKVHVTVTMLSPYEEGFGKTLVAEKYPGT